MRVSNLGVGVYRGARRSESVERHRELGAELGGEMRQRRGEKSGEEVGLSDLVLHAGMAPPTVAVAGVKHGSSPLLCKSTSASPRLFSPPP